MRRIAPLPIGQMFALTLAMLGTALGLGALPVDDNPAPGQWQPAAAAAKAAVDLPKGVLPEAVPPPRRDRAIVSIRGRVVDDETGAPIESFSLQKGRVAAGDPSKVSWQYPRQIPNVYTIVDGRAVPDPNPRGEFEEYLDLRGVEEDPWDRIRVLADGFEPEPVTERPFSPADVGKAIEVTVRLRRGRSLVGVVVDHAGRPAAGAGLCLLRPGLGTIRIVDDVIGEGSDTGLLDPSVTRAVADERGRFRITGVGDVRTIGVSAPTLHFWTATIPTPGEELTIRLPEPATLRIPYAIDGDAPEASIWLHLKQPEDLDRTLSVTRNLTVRNGDELVLRDLTPGEYTLWRRKTLPVGEHSQRTSVEHRDITVGAGETAVVDFVREQGSPIAGAVSGPRGGGPRMIFVGIEPAAPPAPAEGLWFPRRFLDIVACDAGGRFRTALIPPGDYVAHAAGYRNGPRYEPFGMLNDAPDFIGLVPVTVPPDGNPPEVRIMLDDRRPIGPPNPALGDSDSGGPRPVDRIHPASHRGRSSAKRSEVRQ